MSSLALTASTAHTLALLPQRARTDYEFWSGIVAPLLEHPARNLRAALREAARAAGVPEKTLEKRYYRAAGGGLLALIDKRLCGAKYWRRKSPRKNAATLLSAGMISLWRRLCEESNRSCKNAYKRLERMWRDRDPEIAAIPEFADFPGWPALPRGLKYNNLMRAAPSAYELALARRGRSAAQPLAPCVRTTRAGLYPGSHYMFDDKWHDMFINSLADAQTGRPLEIYSLDYFSACKRRWGIRLRTKNNAGKWSGIPGVMMRFVLAATLYLDGFSPRGTVLVAEKNTAKIDGHIAAFLHDVSGGLITTETSGLLNEAALAGQYPVIRSGNPRIKAALESNNNLEHNRLDHLPGQTGRNVETRPAELKGRLDYNATLMRVRDRLPAELQDRLDFPLLELTAHWLPLVQRIYNEIADDRDHALEGWIEAGNIIQMIKLGGVLMPETRLTPDQRERLPELIASGVVDVTPARMTRREAWERGADALIKMPGWGVCEILGDDLARETTLSKRNEFEIYEKEISPGAPLRYSPIIYDIEGNPRTLRGGEKYQVFMNPFATGTLFVRDAKGAYLGESTRLVAPTRGDHDAVVRAIGRISGIHNDLSENMRARHAAKPGPGGGIARARRQDNNASLARLSGGAATTPRARPEPHYTDGADAVTILLAENASEQNDGE